MSLSVESELYFLIADFLSRHSPCVRSAQVLKEELSAHSLLPPCADWSGEPRRADYDDISKVREAESYVALKKEEIWRMCSILRCIAVFGFLLKRYCENDIPPALFVFAIEKLTQRDVHVNRRFRIFEPISFSS